MSGRRPLGLTLVALALLSQMPAGWSGWLMYVPIEACRFVMIPGESTLRQVSLTLRPGTQRGPALPPDIVARLAELNDQDPAAARDLYDNFLALKARNERLTNRVAALEEEIAQLSRVREGLGDRPLRYIRARVTSERGGPVERTLTLDRGRASGVAERQTVVAGANLVGEVIEVTGRTSEVRLITAPGTTLRARLGPADASEPRSVVEQFAVLDDGSGFVTEVAIGAPVREGDLAHLVDDLGRWPTAADGRVIGVVTTIDDRTDQPVQLKRVVVTPLRDLTRLARVTVIAEVGQAIDEGGSEGGDR